MTCYPEDENRSGINFDKMCRNSLCFLKRKHSSKGAVKTVLNRQRVNFRTSKRQNENGKY